MASHSLWYWTFNSPLYPTTQIKTKFLNYLCLKNGFLHLYLRYCDVCLFWVSAPLKAYSEVNVLNISPPWSNYSVLLTTAQINDRRFCLQCWTFFRVPAYNVEKYSNFSLCVFFCVFAYTAEKLLVLLTRTQKNVWIQISPQIQHHMQIYVRVFNQGPRLMCFMMKSWGEKSCGTVSFKVQHSGSPFFRWYTTCISNVNRRISWRNLSLILVVREHENGKIYCKTLTVRHFFNFHHCFLHVKTNVWPLEVLYCVAVSTVFSNHSILCI